jgi:hypothetical protein
MLPFQRAVLGCAGVTLLGLLVVDCVTLWGIVLEAVAFLLLLIPTYRTNPPQAALRAAKVGLLSVCGLGLTMVLLLDAAGMIGVAFAFVALPLQLLIAVWVVVVALLAKSPQQPEPE